MIQTNLRTARFAEARAITGFALTALVGPLPRPDQLQYSYCVLPVVAAAFFSGAAATFSSSALSPQWRGTAQLGATIALN